jgi:hypothetical protein
MTKPAAPILKLQRITVDLDIPGAVDAVRRASGKGPFRQACEIAAFALGKQRLSFKDYYLEGLWRPELTAAEKAAFVSEAKSTAINRQLAPVNGLGLQGFFTDKLLTGLTLRAAGFPILRPRAIYGKVLKLSGTERLESAADIVAFLLREGALPVFGKPLHASLSIGAVSILSVRDGGRSLVLGDGRIVGLEALSHEIAANFPQGYVFEPLIRQHSDVEAITGPAVGGLRVVTLRTPEDAAVLYTVQRLPGAGAMMDAMSSHGAYCVAYIDPDTGRVIRASAMDQSAPTRLEVSVVTGARFDEAVVPFVKAAHAIAIDAHRLFVRPGLLGFDFALTPEGPLITEINSNPFHATYQHAADRGLLNPDFTPAIKVALDVVRAEAGKA